MFDKAFPSELSEALQGVLNCLPDKTFYGISISISNDMVSYNLNNRVIEFPYRIYLLDVSDTEYDSLGQVQQQMLCCIYTRSSDGYIREKYLRKLLDMEFEQWTIPFIVKLCDEYVLEILEMIYSKLKERNNKDIYDFCLKNKSSIQKSYARMISYWNEYYRGQESDFRKYIGRRLFRECLGYNKTFED